MIGSWREYCLLTYGIDIGIITDKEYQKIIDSPDIKQMKDFPSKDSCCVINGCLVIMLDGRSIAR